MATEMIYVMRGEVTDAIVADDAVAYASSDRLVLLRDGKEVAWYRLSAIDGWTTDEALVGVPKESA